MRPPAPKFPFLIPFPKRTETGQFEGPRVPGDTQEEALPESRSILEREEEMVRFFTDIIPVLDELTAMKRAIDKTGEEEWKEGVAFFYEKLLHTFASFDFTLLGEMGKPFDPSFHEAVGTGEGTGIPPGSIVDVVQPGWKYGDRVLRFAKVLIAQ
jgi:molecular chaperone GrpE